MRRFRSTLPSGCLRPYAAPAASLAEGAGLAGLSLLLASGSLHLSVSRPPVSASEARGAEGEVGWGVRGGRLPVLLRGSCGREGLKPPPCRGPNHLTSLDSASSVYAAPHRGGGFSSFSLRQPFLRTAERTRFHTAPPRSEGSHGTRGRVGACAPVEERGAEGKREPRGSDGRATAEPENLGTHNTQRGADGLALAVGRAAPGTQLNSLRPEGVWGVQCLLPRPTPWPRGGMERPGLSDQSTNPHVRDGGLCFKRKIT